MRRGRIFLYLALILILGVAAIYFVGRPFLFPEETGGEVGVGDQSPSEPTPTAPAVQVVYVTQKVTRGSVIGEDLLGLVPYQQDLLIPGMFTNFEDVAGKLAKYDLEANTILSENLVADLVTGGGNPAALLIDPGMVAVSIPINRLTSVAFAPQRGDRVDVIATMMFVDVDAAYQSRLPNNTAIVIAPGFTEEMTTLTASLNQGGVPFGRAEIDALLEQTFYVVPSEPQRARLVSQTLIQNAMVLQMGDFQIPEEPKSVTAELETTAQVTPTPAPPSQVQATEEPAGPPPPDLITLIVSPQDAVALNYLIYSGAQLSLALRGPKDVETIATEAVTLQFLLEQYNIPIPVKLPYATEPRLDEIVPPELPNDATPTPEG